MRCINVAGTHLIEFDIGVDGGFVPISITKTSETLLNSPVTLTANSDFFYDPSQERSYLIDPLGISIIYDHDNGTILHFQNPNTIVAIIYMRYTAHAMTDSTYLCISIDFSNNMIMDFRESTFPFNNIDPAETQVSIMNYGSAITPIDAHLIAFPFFIVQQTKHGLTVHELKIYKIVEVTPTSKIPIEIVTTTSGTSIDRDYKKVKVGFIEHFHILAIVKVGGLADDQIVVLKFDPVSKTIVEHIPIHT